MSDAARASARHEPQPTKFTEDPVSRFFSVLTFRAFRTLGRVRRFVSHLFAAALVAAAAYASGAPADHARSYRQFWVTETISGRTVGPVVAKPGNRFAAAGGNWIVLESAAGQINFADAETLAAQGPYDLIEQRVFDLGSVACVFSRVEPFRGSNPTADIAIVTQARRVPAETGGALPERWELSPVPSTNPGAHKEAAPTWHAVRFFPKTDATLFLDAIHRVQHDWKLGGMGGKKKEPLSSTRIGAAGQWNGFSGEFGWASGAKSSGSIVEDSLSVSSLKIRSGSGLFAAAGWDYLLQVADGWSASLGVRALWERFSADVSATTLRAKVPPATDSGSDAAPQDPNALSPSDWSSNIDIDEFVFRACAGVRYDDWYWGVGMTFAVDCWSDTSSGANVPVGDNSYKIESERSQPAALSFSGWYTPDDIWVLKGGVSVGAETTLRIGVGWLF